MSLSTSGTPNGLEDDIERENDQKGNASIPIRVTRLVSVFAVQAMHVLIDLVQQSAQVVDLILQFPQPLFSLIGPETFGVTRAFRVVRLVVRMVRLLEGTLGLMDVFHHAIGHIT